MNHGWTMVEPWLNHGWTMVEPWLNHDWTINEPSMNHQWTLIELLSYFWVLLTLCLKCDISNPKIRQYKKPPCTYQGLGNLVVDKVKKLSTIKSEYGQFLTPCDSIKRQECSKQMRSRSESGTRSSVTKTTVSESPNLGNSQGWCGILTR